MLAAPVLFDNVNFTIEKGQKTVFLSHNPKAMTALFEIINMATVKLKLAPINEESLSRQPIFH